MSSQGREPRSVVRADDTEVLQSPTQSGLIIVPFSEDGISSMVWGTMMKQLLSGEQVNSKTGVVITATQSSASRVQLVEGGRGSEIRLLPPPEKPDESDNAEWVSIHIPLERLDGLALGAGARLRRSWLGPALASTIILAGLVLGATGAKTLPYASTSTATAASAVESSKMPPPRRPSVVVVRAKGTKQPTSAKPVERHAAMVKPSRLAAKAG